MPMVAADQSGNREMAKQICHVHSSAADLKATNSPWGEGEVLAGP